MMLSETSTLSEDDLKKAASFMLTPKASQYPKLAKAGFRIYEGMFVTYKRHPCKLIECYYFEFAHSHQRIEPHLAINMRRLPAQYLVLSAQEIREILAISDELTAQVIPLLSQFTIEAKRKCTLPPDSDIEFYQSRVNRLMTLPDRGPFAPIFSSLALHADIKIVFSTVEENTETFRVTCFQARSPVLELARVGQISKGRLTQFQERPGKYYLSFDSKEAFEATCLALPQHFRENSDYRKANKKQTLEIMGCLLDFYPDITPHIFLSKAQIVALGKAYVLGLHHGSISESSSGNRVLNFSHQESKVFLEICEKIKEGLDITPVMHGEKMIAVTPEIASILDNIFNITAKSSLSLR